MFPSTVARGPIIAPAPTWREAFFEKKKKKAEEKNEWKGFLKKKKKEKTFFSFYLWMPVSLLLPVSPERHRVAQHRPLPYHGGLPDHDPERVTEQDSGSERGPRVQVCAENFRSPRLQGQRRVLLSHAEEPGADALGGQGMEAVVEEEDVSGGPFEGGGRERREDGRRQRRRRRRQRRRRS